jgi:uncharacterized membrane protein (UPF0136 family)
MNKFEKYLNGMATASARFSLGFVLAMMPILFAHLYDHNSAKTLALAINFSGYSSWLVFGGYATVMRDFRLADSDSKKHRLTTVYEYFAIFQSIGAIILTFGITVIYLDLHTPYVHVKEQEFLVTCLIFGVIVQCSSFWANLALGVGYSSGRFFGIGIGISVVRTSMLAVVAATSYVLSDPKTVLVVLTVLYSLGSLFLYRKHRVKFPASELSIKANWVNLVSLFKDSTIYFKWSVLATAVFLFPVTAIASVSPDVLLSATIAFFMAGASQNLVAAFITPQANNLQDGVGDLEALKTYFYLTAKVSLLVTFLALFLLWCLEPFVKNVISSNEQDEIFLTTVVLIIAAGFRAWTSAPTQAAIALKKENLVMRSPILEALFSVFGVSVCWIFERGDLIFFVFVVSVLIRLFITIFFEISLITECWKVKI